MALSTPVQNEQVYHRSGTPVNDTDYELCDFKFKARGLKIIVTAGTLDISFDGKDDYGVLDSAVNGGVFEFNDILMPKIWVKDNSATFQMWAWADF